MSGNVSKFIYVFDMFYLGKTREHDGCIETGISGQHVLLMLLCVFLVGYELFLFLVCFTMRYYMCSKQKLDWQ